MTERSPRVWVLLGSRIGDNNQLLALAEALELPFETRTLTYRRWWPLWLRLSPGGLDLLDRRSRDFIAPPWPDLVIGIGRRSVAVARWIKHRTGGAAKIVRLGNPRSHPSLFDLVITTGQYPVPAASNVLVLPLAMSRHKDAKPTVDEAAWLKSLPRPHLLFSLGGATRYWDFPAERMAAAAATLAGRAAAAGGTLIAVASPRTPAEALAAIERSLTDRTGWQLIKDGRVRFPVLLADADENYVTADSVSMLSEAVLAGKPVGVVPVDLDSEGRRALGPVPGSSSVRDIRRFWQLLHDRALVGTLELPAIGAVEDPVTIAATAVKALLGDRVE